ncbi:MAG: CUB domain-containing protein [Campylobacterota bacterium]|nr:CUB domain-containing protein [Campylobacterota bacterium]
MKNIYSSSAALLLPLALCFSGCNSVVEEKAYDDTYVDMQTLTYTLDDTSLFYDNGGETENYSKKGSVLTVVPQKDGKKVSVSFTSFETEACCDKLSIYDGNSTSSGYIGSFSGTNIPPNIISTASDGALTFAFDVDSENNSTGWIATLDEVDNETALYMRDGSYKVNNAIAFYDGGGDTNNYMDTNKTITIYPNTIGKKVSIEFDSFDTVPDSDYMYLYDGNSTSSPIVGGFSGNAGAVPPSLTSTASDGAITLAFKHTDTTDYTYTGWSANIFETSFIDKIYMRDGNFTLTQETTFFDDGGENFGYTGADKNLTIYPSNPSKDVTISFSSFDTADTDILRIYDGNATVPYKEFSGEDTPEDITSQFDDGRLEIGFISSTTQSTHEYEGWEATLGE